MAIVKFFAGSMEVTLGAACKQAGDMAAACAHWRKARDLFTELGAPHMVEKVEGWLREANCPAK